MRPISRFLRAALLPALLAGPVSAKDLPNYDAGSDGVARTKAIVSLTAPERALIKPGTEVQTDPRSGLPTFVWAAAPRDESASPARRGLGAEQAAREHLRAYARIYRLAPGDLDAAVLRQLHDTGRGAVIVTLGQESDGVEIFRDEIRVAMNRDLELIALSGHLTGVPATAAKRGPRFFRRGAAEAVASALIDLTEARVDWRRLRPAGPSQGAYETFELARRAAEEAGIAMSQPARAKPVLYRLPDRLVPAYYVEVETAATGTVEAAAYAYVLSAEDGRLLFRKSLTNDVAFTYRVWAETTGIHLPTDGPQDGASSPHPTGLPDSYQALFTAPVLVTQQNGPISTNDPWLASGATTTVGNNAEAYADITSPDGFGAGDFRATTTAPGTFDRTYDTSLPPSSSQAQRMAAITQLFYMNNFLHDWFYDSGFNEISRNAQTDNYGRGGAAGDSIRAEAQDFSGRNNANMTTPADGGRPRMQMYVFDGIAPRSLEILSPAAIADLYATGYATWGPTAFDVTDDIAPVADAVAPATDGCTAFGGVAGKIAFIDRGACNFTVKVENAQAAGAVGVIIANVPASLSPEVPPLMGGTPAGAITIGTLSLNLVNGDRIRAGLAGGPVSGRLLRQAGLERDGTIDNSIVAHEWGHYLSNRLIGNGSGLFNNQGGGMGEGWSDFVSLLMTAREEDATAPAGADYSGAYTIAPYVSSGGTSPGYYFGIRRVPYSTDFGKDPLTFRHIANGAPLPQTVPLAFGADGASNAEVHNTGEVWATMLWECYAALLRDTLGPSARLSFEEAQQRMRDYLVASLKLTPTTPTLIEARDAVLAAALAGDSADHRLFWRAFARRGIGHGAEGPEETSTTNQPVTESYVGSDLVLTSAVLEDAPACDGDGVLDEGEPGHLTITLTNTGLAALSATTATIAADDPALVFPSGTAFSFPASLPGATTTAVVPVDLAGAAGIERIGLTLTVGDPGFLIPGAITMRFARLANFDDRPAQAAADTVESALTAWTAAADGGLDTSMPWRRVEVDAAQHVWLAPDTPAVSDHSLVSPVLQVSPTGSFSFTFRHRHQFEFAVDPALALYDGGVVEISTDGGGVWTDAGAFATPGYDGPIETGFGNPLAARPAFGGANPSWPNFDTVTVDLGTAYQGQSVRIRFRTGTDLGAGAPGWELDDLSFSNVLNTPFGALVPEDGICPDADGDTYFDPVDCDPGDPAVWSPPDPAADLTLEGQPVTTLTWTAPANVGGVALVVTYDVLRSSSAGSLGGAVCVESGGGDLTASDAAAPAGAYFYLVRSRTICGDNLGAGSDGTARSGPTCP